MDRLIAYVSDGINNVSVFDVDDLFAGKNAAYSTSETHFKSKAEAGEYEKFVDVRRCRISQVLPLPLRARSLKGYEILSEEDVSPDALPADLKSTQKLALDNEQTKDKLWERRLLDLSMKNTLLNFSPVKGVAHVLSNEPDETMDALTQAGEMTLAPASAALNGLKQADKAFGAKTAWKGLKELIELENRSGILRTVLDEKTLTETVSRLMRKSKEADEESGTKILYLALGFLKWYSREDGEERYAPLVLQPVTLKKSKGGAGYAIALTDDDVSVNATLLEYLKQELNIKILK